MAKGSDPTLIGRTIAGKFTIESYIGAGAMGAVYRARQTALDKTIALKVLHRELTTEEAFTARFKREAKAASRLDHPNSVRVIDFGVESDGIMYIAMELLDGRDLLRVVADDWPLSSSRIADIVMQALAALSVAHDMGVVHRDLKPENIMILAGSNDEGQPTDLVKVCDFGIAKLTERRDERLSQGGGPLTGQGLVIGTPEYMSPEQGRGDSLDLRSDLYSIGVIIFQLLTRRVPFDAESALGIVFKQVTEEPVRPSSINPAADLRLEAICLRAMRKRREDRYQSAREMRTDLRLVLGSSASLVRPSPSRDAPLPEATDTVLGVPVRSTGAAILPAGEDPDLRPKTTAGATAFLDERALPRGPSLIVVGFAIAAIGAVVAAALVLRGSRSPAADTGGPGPATSETARDAAKVEEERSSAAGGPSRPTDTDVASALPAPSLAPSASTLATKSTHAPRPSPAANAPPRAQPSMAAPAATATSFDPTTASANPSIVHAEGASARDVRAALPSTQFTQCYRDALRRLGRRIEGKMSVHVQIGTDGHVTTALVSAPESLAQGIGGCVTQTFNRLPIANVAAEGGAADVNIVFVPE